MLHAKTGQVQAFKHAYPICCHLSMVNLMSLMVDLNIDREILYTFEAGHQNEGDARQFIQAIVKNPKLKEDFHHCEDEFLPKDRAVPLQAADLFAWEWAKCHEETIDQRVRPVRQCLLALFRRAPKRYRVAHVSGEKLLQWLSRMPGLLREDGIIDAAGKTIVQ